MLIGACNLMFVPNSRLQVQWLLQSLLAANKDEAVGTPGQTFGTRFPTAVLRARAACQNVGPVAL